MQCLRPLCHSVALIWVPCMVKLCWSKLIKINQLVNTDSVLLNTLATFSHHYQQIKKWHSYSQSFYVFSTFGQILHLAKVYLSKLKQICCIQNQSAYYNSYNTSPYIFHRIRCLIQMLTEDCITLLPSWKAEPAIVTSTVAGKLVWKHQLIISIKRQLND